MIKDLIKIQKQFFCLIVILLSIISIVDGQSGIDNNPIVITIYSRRDISSENIDPAISYTLSEFGTLIESTYETLVIEDWNNPGTFVG